MIFMVVKQIFNIITEGKTLTIGVKDGIIKTVIGSD